MEDRKEGMMNKKERFLAAMRRATERRERAEEGRQGEWPEESLSSREDISGSEERGGAERPRGVWHKAKRRRIT